MVDNIFVLFPCLVRRSSLDVVFASGVRTYIHTYVRPSFRPFVLLLARGRACKTEQAMGWLDETPDKDARVLLLVALRDITDGKIFVEAERAKLTRMLAKVLY